MHEAPGPARHRTRGHGGPGVPVLVRAPLNAILARWRATALDVAVLRIVVVAVLATTPEIGRAVTLASGSHAAWHAPLGLGWFVRWVPTDGSTASLVRLVHYNVAALAAVGLFTRPALVGLALTSYYLLALNQLSGAVLHDMHAWWFVVILALAAPGEALAVDAWYARKDAGLRLLGDPAPARRHALPLALVGTLLGLVYFFPGAWKLGSGGPSWALSDNVLQQMHAKWFQYGVVPTWRVDHHPGLVRLGAALAVFFELGFVLLVHVGPRVRVALAVAGLCFHLSIQRFLFIGFSSLWLCYAALVPWHVLRRQRVPGPPPTDRRMQDAWIIAFGAVLIALLIERGVRGASESWPVACYPRFHRSVGPTLQDVRVVALGAGEREVPVGRDASGMRTQAEWATAWSVAGIYGVPFSGPRLLGYVRAQAARPHVAAALVGATALRVEVVTYATAPEAWGQPPVTTREVATLPW